MLGTMSVRLYLVGCLLVVLGGIVLSLGVLCVRGAAASDAWQYLFWRALALAVALGIVAAQRHSISPLVQIRRLGGFAWLSVLAMVASQICFIIAIKLGSTAEVFFLMSLAPLLAAALARPLLGERIGTHGVLAIAVALGGIAVMTGLGSKTDGVRLGSWEGEWLPRLLALATALTFALYLLATRGAPPADLDAALVAVGIITAVASAIVLLWRGVPFSAGIGDTALALLHGSVILSIGLVLFARGSRVVPGVTLAMLAQSETVAAPIWTYLVLGETTTPSVMAGGALIVVALMMHASEGHYRRGKEDHAQ